MIVDVSDRETVEMSYELFVQFAKARGFELVKSENGLSAMEQP